MEFVEAQPERVGDAPDRDEGWRGYAPILQAPDGIDAELRSNSDLLSRAARSPARLGDEVPQTLAVTPIHGGDLRS